MDKNTRRKLLQWFDQFKRPWPWRHTKDPYSIWISEVMLQQTTSAAVAPYYQKFLLKFPDLSVLANAPIESVLESWSGLGYYSRARNLHKAAQILNQKSEFPKTHQELLEIPGFGPYTARSVSSIAFENPVGVLDGNVIRVVSRYEARAFQWWKTGERAQMQDIVDTWVQGFSSAQMNPALMELGSTICLPKNPKCVLCPLAESCKGLQQRALHMYPVTRPRKAKEVWLWRAELEHSKGHVKLVKNNYAPFLKGQWILPGSAKKLGLKPKSFSFKHSITHHDIYVQIIPKKVRMKSRITKQGVWTPIHESRKMAPTNLVQKALRTLSVPKPD
jgi:A/G-specific adenine glycosylase